MDEGKAAVLMVRALLEGLIKDGVLTRDRVLEILARAKDISAAEMPLRFSRKGEDSVIDNVIKELA
jgi:hypothetical protein